MTQYVIANNVNTQLAAAATSSSTTLTLASSSNLPTLSAGQVMPLTLNDAGTGLSYEIVYVTAISGVTLTVIRGQEGTGALSWNVGDYAFCGPTAQTVATALGNPSNQFVVAAATATGQAVNLGQFLSSLGVSGYQKFPAAPGQPALIMQFGQTGVSSASGPTTITYPIAFPNGFYGVTVGAVGSNGLAVATVDGTPNATSFPYSVWNASGTRIGALGARYIAFGY